MYGAGDTLTCDLLVIGADMTAAGEPAPAQLAAGADAGYRGGYAGGLAIARTFGFRAAQVGAA